MSSRLPIIKKVQFNELILPVSKTKVKWRPFTVGEQKLIVHQKSKAKSELHAVVLAMDVLQGCVEGADIKKLSMFDFQYLFFQIRNSSEGADLTFKLECEKCNVKTEITIDLNSDLVIEGADTPQEKSIQIKDEDIVLKLGHPTVIDVLNSRDGEGTDEDKAFKLIPKCIKAIATSQENITDFSDDELEQFADQLDANTFKQIVNFIKDAPSYASKKKFACCKCGHEHSLTKEEIAGFFT